ncbi:MAG: GldG family protein [Myxococcales bacterium]|nr:GldG family protein [Myxococcales bacterium]
MAIMSDTSVNEAKSQEGALATQHPITTLGLILGVIGSTAVVFGAILYALDPLVLPLAIGNVGVGIACLCFYAATHRHLFFRAISGRSTPLIALEVAMAVGVLGGGFVINWLSAQNPIEWDLTEDGIYSLRPQSVAVAKRLNKTITIYAFYSRGENTRGILEQAIELYSLYTTQIDLKFINPDQAPAQLLKRFDINSRSTRIVFSDESSGSYTKIKHPTEEAITNALIQVAEKRQKKAYFVTGHGEPDIKDQTTDGYLSAATLLGNEGIVVESLALVNLSDVPDDASVVVIAGSQSPLLPNEAAAANVFLDRGGRMLVLVEPGHAHGLDNLLRSYGVAVEEHMIMDENPASKALGFGLDAPMIRKYEPHPITDVMGNAFTMFFRARSLRPIEKLARINPTVLIRTEASAWAESNWQNATDFSKDENDVEGPVAMAIAVTKRTSTHPSRLTEQARLVVVGDHHFASNRFSTIRGNIDFFVNTVNWLVGDEDRITIRPPKKTGDRLPLTERQQYGIMFFTVNLLPLVIIGVGFSVWAVRRRK